MKKFAILFLLLGLISNGGCGGSSDTNKTEETRGELVSFDLMPEIWGKKVSIDEEFFLTNEPSGNSAASLDAKSFFYNITSGDLSDDLFAQYGTNNQADTGSIPWQIIKLLGQIWLRWSGLEAHFDYFPISYNVSYKSLNANGKEETLTGRVIYPANLGRKIIGYQAPILLIQHPTQVMRSQSPSRISYLPWEFNHDSQLTVTLGMIIASTGYVVVIPDYIGMGDNKSVHPYCHESLAYSVVDMVPAALKVYEKSSSVTGLIPWDKKKLFLMGFSEGGYATMVAAKELQQNKGKYGYPVTGAACLDGPYSLSGTMSKLILSADKNFSSPYFLPYVLNGYGSAYAEKYPEFSYKGAVRSDVEGYEGEKFADELAKLMNGDYQADEISNLMRKAPTPATYAGPSSILSTTFNKALNDPNSIVSKKLKENNAFNWKPEMPLRMFHHPEDDSVPVGNMNEAYDYFMNVVKASPAHVTTQTFTDRLDIAGQSMHERAYPFAFLYGFIWIDRMAYPGRAGW